MRTLFCSVALVLLALGSALAGRLDIAVIQFPELKTPAELNAALAGENLFAITDSNRTMSKESYLKGGWVLFAQSVPASPGSVFSTSTRIKDDRADVEGRLGSGNVSVKVSIMSGVKAGLRRFEKSVYSGEGAVPGSAPRVLSIRQVKGKSPQVVKGESKIQTYEYSTAVIVQYTP